MKSLGVRWLLIFALCLLASPQAQAARFGPGDFICDWGREHDQRACQLANEGNWDAALKEAQLAVDEDRISTQYRGNLSYIYLKIGDEAMLQQRFADAAKSYRKAIFNNAENSVAAANLDECLRCQRLDPSDAHVRALQAEEAEREHDWQAAVVEYDICTRYSASAENYFNLGRCEMLAGRKDARSHFELALKKEWGNGSWADRAACQTLVSQFSDSMFSYHARLMLIEISERKTLHKQAAR